MRQVKPDVEREVAAARTARDFEAAATAALRGYGPDVLGFLYKVIGNETVADDVFSAFSEDLWRSIERFEGKSSFGTWAHRLAWHAACRHWKDPWQRRRRALEHTAAERIVQQIRTRTCSYLRTEAKDWLAQVNAKLSPTERLFLDLRVGREMSLEEIANVLGATNEAARQRWSRLKRKLQGMARARAAEPLEE